jgi:hypothetical protein
MAQALSQQSCSCLSWSPGISNQLHFNSLHAKHWLMSVHISLNLNLNLNLNFKKERKKERKNPKQKDDEP